MQRTPPPNGGSPGAPRPGDGPAREHRKCDACGRETLCVLMPTARGPNTGALCLDCLRNALIGLQNDPNR